MPAFPPMDVLVAGAGMVGLALARSLRARGVEAVVVDRAPAGFHVPGPIMMPYHAYDALRDAGVLEAVRARGRDIATGPDGVPVSIAVGRADVLEELRDGQPARYGTALVDLARAPDGRVTGARLADHTGEHEVRADLVVGADGARSRVRELSGLPAEVSVGGFAGLSFRSPTVLPEPFAMAYQSDGRQVTCVSWPGGSAGTFQIDPMGAEAARAPGLPAYREAVARLLPASAPALAAVTEESWFYRETTEVRAPRWWAPGVVLVGEAAHAINPETGVGAGLGLGDALALAIAVAGAGGDPDRACRDYETWRRPAVAPYEQLGVLGTRLPDEPAQGEVGGNQSSQSHALRGGLVKEPTGAPGAPRPEAERWPPR